MSAYIVFTRTKTLDEGELNIYREHIKETLAGHPVEVLVAYGKHQVLEGNPIEGIVIAKFPDKKSAMTWYESDAYQKLAKHRRLGGNYEGILVEGVA